MGNCIQNKKMKEGIGNLKKNKCSIQILFLDQTQYIHSTTCNSKKASVCNGLYDKTTFSDMCTKLEYQAKKCDPI